MYFQEDGVEKFAEILEHMKITAQERQQLIARVDDRCAPPCDRGKDLKDKDELMKRARNVELNAMNNLAYAIAEDLARELKAAEPFMPIAEEYAQILSEAMKSEKDRQNEFVAPNRYDFLDTAAFVTIVTEAKRKSNVIDRKKVEDAINVLEKVVSREEVRINGLNQRQKYQYESLNIYRAHLTSARGLLQ
jgi:hypothetical protein